MFTALSAALHFQVETRESGTKKATSFDAAFFA